MQIVAIIFFSAALILSLAVVAQMLFTYRHRIIEALTGQAIEPKIGPSAEVFYLQPRHTIEIEWRRAA